jgi:hypothetical protein
MASPGEWKKDLGWLALLYLLVLLLYREVAFFGRMFVSADTIAQGAVFLKYGFGQLESGQYPLWFPHIFSGMPFFASMSFDLFVYPIRILLHYADQIGLHVLHYKIVHFFLGGLFTYLLMRSYRLARTSAFLAAAVFIFSPMVASLEHGNRIITVAYIPAVFYLVRRLLHRRDLFSLALAGLFIGFQMMANHLQIVYYTWLLMGLWFLARAAAQIRERRSWGRSLTDGAWLAGAFVIGLGVAALLLLSVYEYTPFSARASGDPAAAYDFATQWSLHPAEMLSFIIPSFMGFGGQTYWGLMPFTHCPNYLGIVALMLAASALILRRDRRTLFFAVAGGLAVVISFGRYLPLLYKPMYWLLPFFDKFRVPAMILMVLFFCVAALAGFGLQAVLDAAAGERKGRGSDRRELLARRLMIIAVVLVGLGLILTLARGPLADLFAGWARTGDAAMNRYGQLSPQVRAQLDGQRYGLFFADLWKGLLLAAAALLLAALLLRRKLTSGLFAGLIIALVLVDLWWVDLKAVSFGQRRGYEQTYYRQRRDDVIRFLESDEDLFRILPLDQITSNEYAYYDIGSVGGYHPAKLGIYQRAMEQIGPGNPNFIDLLNVKYLITRRSIDHPRFERILEGASGTVYRNRMALPRAFMVFQYEIQAGEEEAFRRLASEDFDPRKTVLLTKDPGLTPDPAGEGEADITGYAPHRIAARTRSSAPGLLVFSEVYYPAGWEALVDGEPAEILQADGLLRAVALPAGEHLVEMVFRPRTFRTGLWTSLLFLGGITIALAVTGLRGVGLRRRTARGGGKQ